MSTDEPPPPEFFLPPPLVRVDPVARRWPEDVGLARLHSDVRISASLRDLDAIYTTLRAGLLQSVPNEPLDGIRSATSAEKALNALVSAHTKVPRKWRAVVWIDSFAIQFAEDAWEGFQTWRDTDVDRPVWDRVVRQGIVKFWNLFLAYFPDYEPKVFDPKGRLRDDVHAATIAYFRCFWDRKGKTGRARAIPGAKFTSYPHALLSLARSLGLATSKVSSDSFRADLDRHAKRLGSRLARDESKEV